MRKIVTACAALVAFVAAAATGPACSGSDAAAVGGGSSEDTGPGPGSGAAPAVGSGGAGSVTGGPTTGSAGASSASGVGGAGGIGGATTSASASTGVGGVDGGPDACDNHCSGDLHSILDCNGNVVATCNGTDACDPMTKTCVNACTSANANKQSVGCEYYATDMDQGSDAAYCYAAFVANTWNTPAHITVDYQGAALAVGNFARFPSGSGPALTYSAYDPVAGIPPGEVVILFLSGLSGGAPYCPIPSAQATGVMLQQTGIGSSFRIASDVPVVAYQINPYGGGSVAVTGASLLLPTSVWDINYVAAMAYMPDNGIGATGTPSMNIVAMADATTVKLTPVAAVVGGGGVPAGPANMPLSFVLNKGQHAQFSQTAELTGSIVESDKPVGFMAGHRCLRVPVGTAYCDHAEQMIPPVKALGSEYVGVQYRPRVNEQAIWRMVGTVDGTTLTYTSNVGGPATLNLGQIAEFTTDVPFDVKSQDADHPFMLFTYMSGSQWKPGLDGYGDADFVISVPPQQYLPAYVFFADPTYPETNLVVVRSKVQNQFFDVTLDCAGVLGGWQAVGEYEWTRVDLITGNFVNVGNCSTGRHYISSAAPFGLWVWGWGTPLTTSFTANVSYGYPGGMNVQPINDVVVHM